MCPGHLVSPQRTSIIQEKNMKWLLMTLALFCITSPPTGGWQQESFAGVPFLLTSAVGVTPTANGCWTWTSTLTGDPVSVPRGVISGVVPNRPNQWATITDISVTVHASRVERYEVTRSFESGAPSVISKVPFYKTPYPMLFVIRDGNTDNVLYAGSLTTSYFTEEQHYASVTSGTSPNTVQSDYSLIHEKVVLHLNCHLTTPIVLDHSGPNPPVVELCPFTPDTHYGAPGSGPYYFGTGSLVGGSGTTFLWSDGAGGTVSIQGRYVYNT